MRVYPVESLDELPYRGLKVLWEMNAWKGRITPVSADAGGVGGGGGRSNLFWKGISVRC